MESIKALVMGIVEGVTEFLPISSTGHLILARDVLGFDRAMGKEVTDAFIVVIQLGAILAVVAAYPGRFARLLRLGDNRGLSGLRGLWLLVLTSVPAAVLGLLARGEIKSRLMESGPVAVAMAAGAVWILAVEWYRPRVTTEGLDALTWKHALAMGLFQCLSLWPGMSRSAATILGGMISGIERKTATEYSFFAAVPILAAASFYEFSKCLHSLGPGHVQLFAIGFALSFVSAWLAVKGFIRFLGRHTLKPFAWYRLAAAAVVFAWMAQRSA